MRIQIEASGTIHLGGGRQSGPNGLPGVGAANLFFPVKSAFMGTLVAKTRLSNGKDSKKVAVGTRNTLMIEENEYGRLFLGINDSPVSDNQGSYMVSIRW
jgi:hypothetical protein